MNVLVVGAGLGGLTAATRLRQADVDVTVLEARHRVGGRVHSHRFDNGAVVELGGEWIDPAQHAVCTLAEEMGLAMIDTGQDFITRDLIGQDPIDSDEHSQLAGRLFDAMETLGPRLLESMSLADFIDTIPDHGPAMTVLRSRLEGTFAVPLSEIAAIDLDEDFGLLAASSYLRVAGGNDRLAMSMAATLDVRLGTPVDQIEQARSWVRARAGDAKFDANYAVIAVPLPILRSEGFLSEAPVTLQAAMAGLGMGTAAKVAIATHDTPPMFRRQEDDIPGWYWTGADAGGAPRRAITGFAGTLRGADVLVAEASPRLSRAVPETASVGVPLVVHWGADPWSRGCYTALGPGQRRFLAQLQNPWGRIVFAGEHVNGSGTIDGAIRSGNEAARLLLEAM